MQIHELHTRSNARTPHCVAGFFYTRQGVVSFDRNSKVFGFVAKSSGETIAVIARYPEDGEPTCLGLGKAKKGQMRLLTLEEMQSIVAWRDAKATNSTNSAPATSTSDSTHDPIAQEINDLWGQRSGLSGAKLAANTRRLRTLARQGYEVPAGI